LIDFVRKKAYPLLAKRMSGRPSNPAKEIRGNADALDVFTRRILQVPHSAIKAKLDAEKRTPKRVYHGSDASPKRAT
jgi:hypothetical protein